MTILTSRHHGPRDVHVFIVFSYTVQYEGAHGGIECSWAEPRFNHELGPRRIEQLGPLNTPVVPLESAQGSHQLTDPKWKTLVKP